MTNSAWKPTVIGSASGTVLATVLDHASPSPCISSPNPSPSRLPGESRLLDLPSLAAFQELFPEVPPAVAMRAHGMLQGLTPPHWQLADWLSLAQGVQTEVSQLLGGELGQQPASKTSNTSNTSQHQGLVELADLPRHMYRLQQLLETLLQALLHPPRFFRAAHPAQLWAKQQPEITQLTQLLHEGVQHALARLASLQQRQGQIGELEQAGASWLCVLEYLYAGLRAGLRVAPHEQLAIGDILDGRRLALQHSMALLQQQQLYVVQEERSLLALIPQIQDCILQQLPALQQSIQHLPASVDATQRFLISQQIGQVLSALAYNNPTHPNNQRNHQGNAHGSAT